MREGQKVHFRHISPALPLYALILIFGAPVETGKE
jgi:hypothetical protein